MAVSFIHGKNAKIIMQGFEIPSARTWRFVTDTDLVEISVIGAEWKSWLNLPMKWEGEAEGNLDLNMDINAFINQSLGYGIGAAIPIALYPTRTNMSRFYSGSVWPKLTVDVGIKGVARYTLGWTGEGALVSN